MSVQNEITRIKNNVNNALTSLSNKGVSVPNGSNSNNLSTLIDSIQFQKYYTGSSAPTSSLGNNGDIYLKV